MSALDRLRAAGRVYLAGPYRAHREDLEAAARDHAALAGRLTAAGVWVYSPIAHSHWVARYAGLDPRDDELWSDLCRRELARSDLLCVAMLPGWRESAGTAVEIAEAERLRMPVEYLEPGVLD